MPTNELTGATVQMLSEVEAPEPVVVSLFLDLDPTEFATPPARASQITSLLSELDAALREADLSHEAKESLKADRERIEVTLRDDDLDLDGAGALAVFASDALDLFATVKLAKPVEGAVHVAERPAMEPLMAVQDDATWCVLLVTRDSARIFRGGPAGLRELRGVRSDVKNQHSAGGWSQARYERSVEEDVADHLEAAADLLFRQFKRRPFDHLVIGANNEALRPALAGETHSYLAERIRGWVDIDERLAGPDEVLEAVRGVMEAHEAEEEQALFERIRAAQGTDAPAAAGSADVLAALVERRVETLLVREAAVEHGRKCVTCGWLGTAARRECPVDGTRLDEVDNVVEPAIQAAVQQSARVHVIRKDGLDGDDAPFEGALAAVLRY